MKEDHVFVPSPHSVKRERVVDESQSGSSRKPPDISPHTFVDTTDDAAAYEKMHVHDVYRAIASHFSSTRYKPWPRVKRFIEVQPSHTLIVDVGCGNGKYFACCQQRQGQGRTREETGEDDLHCSDELTVRGELEAVDGIGLPTRRYVLGLDYSVELLRCTQRFIVDPNYDLSVPTVPHVHRNTAQKAWQTAPLPRTDTLRCDAAACPLRDGVFDLALSIAVIHHYATHARRTRAIRELLRLVRPKGGKVLIYAWALEQPPKAGRTVDECTGDALVRWEQHERYDAQKTTYHRYYHLFRKGELEALCTEAASTPTTLPIRIVEVYYDKENWCVELERL